MSVGKRENLYIECWKTIVHMRVAWEAFDEDEIEGEIWSKILTYN